MNTPDSKRAMRIRWYRLWLVRKICWYAFNYIMKISIDHVYLCLSGMELLYDRRKGLSFRDVRFDSSNRNEIAIPLKMDRTFTRNLMKGEERFPLKTSGNDSTFCHSRMLLSGILESSKSKIPVYLPACRRHFGTQEICGNDYSLKVEYKING